MRIVFRTKLYDKSIFRYKHMTIYGHVPEISVFEQIFNEQTIGNIFSHYTDKISEISKRIGWNSYFILIRRC